MIITRRANRIAEANLIKKAQIKKARRADTTDFDRVADKFVEAVMKIRAAMMASGSKENYNLFFGGFEQCDALLRDPAYHESKEAQFAYQLLLGADSWLRHEADKLGEEYVPPNHFFICWLRHGVDLRNMPV